MADLEEVLSEMDSTDYIHDSIQFIIDKNLRTIPVPSNGSVLGVTGDNNVNRVNFKMERYYDGNDLSTFKIRISYINANGDNNFYDATDMVVEDGNMIFTWLIASDVVAYAGNVSFAVRFFTVDDTDPTKIVKSFNTSIVTANVIQGMYVSDGMSQEDQHDIITQLLSMIEIPEAGGGVGQNTENATYVIDGSTYGGYATAEIFNNYTKNKAIGAYSHAEGSNTTAFASSSHAEGVNTIVKGSGTAAHAEGYGTTASGAYSHAEGSSTIASGMHSHAEGYRATASNVACHAEGQSTTASGQEAHAEGHGTAASGNWSHAEGYYTKAASDYQHVQGKYNVEDTASTYAFIIGNGTSNTERSNAFAIDWDGKIYVGDATEGVDVSTLGGSGGVGQNTEGKTFKVGSSNYSGTETAEIFNDYANNVAVGGCSHAEGYQTKAIGAQSHAEGYGTTASGAYSHAEGMYTYATKEGAHAEGMNTKANAMFTHAEGYSTIAKSDYQHVQGKYNVEDTASTYAFIIGNGEQSSARSNAFAIDWDGKIYVNNATEGVDVAALLGRVAELEAKVAALEGSTS